MENKRLHLQLIQGVISRMASNSFLLKGWSVTLIAALFALAAGESKPSFIFLAYFPCVTFWVLDAYFLRQEKLFRELYDAVRAKNEEDIDFSMNTSSHNDHVEWVGKVMLSKTIGLFHGVVFGTVVLVMTILLITPSSTC